MQRDIPVRNRSPRTSRGAVLYETALVMSLVLLLIMSTIQTALVGFEQMTADMAAEAYGRYDALNISGSDKLTEQLYPQVANAAFSATAMPAPASTAALIPFTNPNGVRHGGYSIVVPAQNVATVKLNVNSVQFGASPAPITGWATEPFFLECGEHFGVQESYGGWCTNGHSDAPSGGGAPNPYTSYFQSGENAPPYYVSVHYLVACSVPYDNNGSTTIPTTSMGNCPAANLYYRALGNAEFLDDQNWCRTVSGASGLATPMPGNTGRNACLSANAGVSTFREMACHQRMYAAFYTNGMTGDFKTDTDPGQPFAYEWNLNNPDGLLATIYSWDQTSGNPPNEGAAYPNAFPLAPLNGCGTALHANATIIP